MLKLVKYCFLYFFLFILCIIVFEFSSHFILKDRIEDIDLSKLWSTYNEEELDRSISTLNINTGLNCVDYIIPTWNHKFGYVSKKIDYECAHKHFEKNNLNIVFFGGSVMDNQRYHNHLTTIDGYVIKNLDNAKSINFAESGSRLSNEYAHFSIMLKNIKPKIAIFFDGYNEFESLKYVNGNYDEDFYWTVWARSRIENPYKIYFNKLVDFSYTAKAFANLFNYQNDNKVKKTIKKKEIVNAANDYMHYQKLINILCKEYNIKCLFFLQPNIYTSKGLDNTIPKHIKKINDYYYPFNNDLYKEAYSILDNEENINLSHILDNQNLAYIDYAHLTKVGSMIIGKEIAKHIKNISE